MIFKKAILSIMIFKKIDDIILFIKKNLNFEIH
jgi:hypothetical protein